jgi:putative acetyltransferase
VHVLIEIREERSDDVVAVREVNRRAFGKDQESNIVDALRTNGGALLSLVDSEWSTGGPYHVQPAHLLLTMLMVWVLGPMAVVPEYQRRGIGTKLIEAGNRKIKDAGYPFIIVVGHAQYYPRFGFRPASEYGIKCEWDVPDEVFMLLVLNESKMQVASGLAKYRHEFSTIS